MNEKEIEHPPSGELTDPDMYRIPGMEDAPPPPAPRWKIVHGEESGMGEKGHFLEVASVGDVYCDALAVVGEEMEVIPVYTRRVWVGWASKKIGHAPPIAVYDKRPPDAVWHEGDGLYLPGGTYVVENRMVYVLYQDAAGIRHMVIVDFNKTSIRESGRWFGMIERSVAVARNQYKRQIGMWAATFILTTDQQSNESHTWRVWHVLPTTKLNAPDGDAYAECKHAYGIARLHADEYMAFGAQSNDVPVVEDDIPF